ncbi:MAG: hypothetical protein ACM3SW_06285 [Actinomycetota bacterium]
MNIEEAEDTLPNGLHDAKLLRFSVDYRAKSAEFRFNAWVGDLESPDNELREKHREVTLRLSGVYFLVLEQPDPAYAYAGAVPTIGGFSAWTGGIAPSQNISSLVQKLPPNAFYDATFVEDWNSFIHIGAEHAEINPVEQ